MMTLLMKVKVMQIRRRKNAKKRKERKLSVYFVPKHLLHTVP